MKGGQTPPAAQVTADDPPVASAPSMAAPKDETTQAARSYPVDEPLPGRALSTGLRVAEPARRQEYREPTDAEIRKRAYELYLARGGQHGRHEDDWYRAEQELRRKKK